MVFVFAQPFKFVYHMEERVKSNLLRGSLSVELKGKMLWLLNCPRLYNVHRGKSGNSGFSIVYF